MVTVVVFWKGKPLLGTGGGGGGGGAELHCAVRISSDKNRPTFCIDTVREKSQMGNSFFES